MKNSVNFALCGKLGKKVSLRLVKLLHNDINSCSISTEGLTHSDTK